jgi:hypothetical protein
MGFPYWEQYREARSVGAGVEVLASCAQSATKCGRQRWAQSNAPDPGKAPAVIPLTEPVGSFLGPWRILILFMKQLKSLTRIFAGFPIGAAGAG